MVNRLSDGLLLWGVLWIWWHTGSVEYDIVTLSTDTSAFMSTAILIGAMGKSAQIGFHVWLADAMEGGYRIVVCPLFLGILFACCSFCTACRQGGPFECTIHTWPLSSYGFLAATVPFVTDINVVTSHYWFDVWGWAYSKSKCA